MIKIPTAAAVPSITLAARETLETLARVYGKAPHVVFSCYTGILSTFGKVHFWVARDRLFRRKASKFGTDEAGLFLSHLYYYLMEVMEPLENPVLYTFGHSYGGWTAMKTAKFFSSRVPVRGLLTIDPISRLACKPMDLLRRLVRPPQGCLQAPADPGLANLAAGVKWWRHYFQDRLYFLHSNIPQSFPAERSGFDQAKINLFSIDPHSALAIFPRVWQETESIILERGPTFVQ